MNKNKLFTMAVTSTLVCAALFAGILVFSVLNYINWNGFQSLLFSKEIIFAIKLSLITATIASLLATAAAIPTAMAISRMTFPGKNIIETLLDIPIIISPIAMGCILLIFFNNTLLGKFIEKNFVTFTFEVSGIILAQFIIVFALAVRILKSTFDDIDERYEKVMRTLGANKIKTFFRCTLPMARHGIIAAFILTWALYGGIWSYSYLSGSKRDENGNSACSHTFKFG
ncbi:MAG: ABC transporter permease subunit [Elusimicrobia bacterium]|nr:ABC transporter permease subunit [Elusimicrobiota bacterium]